MVLVEQVVPWAAMRTWRRVAAVSVITPVPAAWGLWQMTVRPALQPAPSFTKVHALRIVLLELTMRLQLWSVKVSL